MPPIAPIATTNHTRAVFSWPRRPGTLQPRSRGRSGGHGGHSNNGNNGGHGGHGNNGGGDGISRRRDGEKARVEKQKWEDRQYVYVCVCVCACVCLCVFVCVIQ